MHGVSQLLVPSVGDEKFCFSGKSALGALSLPPPGQWLGWCFQVAVPETATLSYVSVLYPLIMTEVNVPMILTLT